MKKDDVRILRKNVSLTFVDIPIGSQLFIKRMSKKEGLAYIDFQYNHVLYNGYHAPIDWILLNSKPIEELTELEKIIYGVK